ncbi:hypothetical protein NQ317_017173 [Molorchus minor]|uniref:Dynein heavy chain n=1 Tax=Molorchus minor TaxID=1323400 RepID=A0ABQ9IX84_9CUCU|nr:hypothetical protein NQ317_017173 [Molorchus minor]
MDPLDAVWIENMNTVLDDNKKLCLMSGEIIQMSKQMNLIFEPADLEQASPATVSRCGMIYMEPALLGWKPLMDSYMATLEEVFTAGAAGVINGVHRNGWCRLVWNTSICTAKNSWKLPIITCFHVRTIVKATELIIQTNQSCCQNFFLKTCLANQICILFVGPTGTGKTAVVLDHLLNMPKEKFLPNIINFSARTTSTLTQETVMSKLDKRRRGRVWSFDGEEMHPFCRRRRNATERGVGRSTPVELLRQWIDHGYWFDKDTSVLQLVDIMFVGAMGVPGGGRNEITERLLRHMQIVCLDSFDDNTLTKIFTTILDWHFAKGYVDDIARLSKFCVAATIGRL